MDLLFIVLYIFSGASSVIITKNSFKTLRNPISIFCILWTIIGVGANLKLYNYYSPSTLVNSCVLSSIWILCILNLVFKSNIRYRSALDNKFFNAYFNYKLFILINIACIVFTLPKVISAFYILVSNGFAYLRASSSDINTGVYVAGWEAAMFSSIIRPIFLTSVICSVVIYFSNLNYYIKRNCFIISIIDTILLVILTAGRGHIVNFTFYLIIASVIFNGKNLFHMIFHNKKIVVMVLMLFMGISYVTIMRDSVNDSVRFFDNLYVYYFSGPSYMSQLLEYETRYGINGDKLYGTATFGFISNWCSSISMLLFGGQRGSLWLMGSQITNKQYWVGEHTYINAMCTAFYTFIIDWGLIGIIIGSSIIYIVSVILMNFMEKNRSIASYSIMVYWIYVLIRTVFKWDLIELDFSVFLFLIYLYTKKFKLIIR